MVVLVLVGQIVTWAAMIRGSRQKDLQRANANGGARAEDVAALHDLVKSVERLNTATEKLEIWSREHERSDDRNWAKTEEIQRQQAATAADMARMLENVQRQMTNVALHMAPADTMELPPTRGGRR